MAEAYGLLVGVFAQDLRLVSRRTAHW